MRLVCSRGPATLDYVGDRTADVSSAEPSFFAEPTEDKTEDTDVGRDAGQEPRGS